MLWASCSLSSFLGIIATRRVSAATCRFFVCLLFSCLSWMIQNKTNCQDSGKHNFFVYSPMLGTFHYSNWSLFFSRNQVKKLHRRLKPNKCPSFSKFMRWQMFILRIVMWILVLLCSLQFVTNWHNSHRSRIAAVWQLQLKNRMVNSKDQRQTIDVIDTRLSSAVWLNTTYMKEMNMVPVKVIIPNRLW